MCVLIWALESGTYFSNCGGVSPQVIQRSMSPDLEADLAQLATHPFTAPRNTHDVMRAIHEALGLPSVTDHHRRLDKLRRWLLAPYSL